MYKLLFFAVFVVAGTTIFIPYGSANAAGSKAANNKCPPSQWTAMDLNHDGYATQDEVAKAAPCIDFDALDTNKDGSISRVEFLNFQEASAKGQSSGASEKHASKTSGAKCPPDNWTALDLNHDGYATKDEVEKAAPCIDFSAVDTSGDGDLSRVEFLNMQEGGSKPSTPAKQQKAGQNQAAQKPAQQESAAAGGNVDQSKYKTPKALVMHVPKGELKNPFNPHDQAIAKEGHQLFLNHGCSGCHGGGGGGGMCPPLTDQIWSYGDDPDTLYRLITLGTKDLQAKFGYTRNIMQTMKADMPPLGPSFKDPQNIWKIITWIESKHLKQ